MVLNNNEDTEVIHIGARALDNIVLRNMLPNIDNIKLFISEFRNNAEKCRKYSDDYDLNHLAYEKYDNFISILGNRGLGKTSIMMTIIKELNNHSFFEPSNNMNTYNYDLISPLIVPDDMSDQSDILGWIIVVLEKIFQQEKEKLTYRHCLDSKEEDMFVDIQEKFFRLKKNYQYRKLDYKKIISEHYEGSSTYVRKMSEVQEQDYQIIDTFHSLIDELIKCKRKINEINRCYEEPLLFLFFDDVDMTAKNSTSILEQLLTFLTHSHIVVFISGDYDLFCQSVTLKMLKDENLENMNIDYIYSYGKDSKDYTAFSLAKSRSEYFLKKVMPPIYRFEIRLLNNRQKASFVYSGSNDSKSSTLTLGKMLGDIFDISDISDKLLFMEYQSQFNGDMHKEKLEDNECVMVYPYYSIFSSNIRGYINVYLYVYNQYIIKNENKEEFNKIKFLEDFLHVVLFSKNVYKTNVQNISNYIYFKDEKRKESQNEDYNKLRIDCEELQAVISEKIIRYRKDETYYLTDNEKNEIEALIMLPVFMNELNLMCFEDTEYKHRHDRIAEKLQNILIYVFADSFNDNISQLIPKGESLNETLLYYSFITTRMSMKTISTLNGETNKQNGLTHKFNENNDKKYLVQIMKCACDVLYIGKANNRLTRKKYDKSCYDNNGREEKEIEIIKAIFDRYRRTDYTWLICLNNIISNNISLVSNLYPYRNFYKNNLQLKFNAVLDIIDSIDYLKKDNDLKIDVKNISNFLKSFNQFFNVKTIMKNSTKNQNKIKLMKEYIQLLQDTIEIFIKKFETLQTNNDEELKYKIGGNYKNIYTNYNVYNEIEFMDFPDQINHLILSLKNIQSQFEKNINEKYVRDVMYNINKTYFSIRKIYNYLLTKINKPNYSFVDFENITNQICNHIYESASFNEIQKAALSEYMIDVVVDVYHNSFDDTDWESVYDGIHNILEQFNLSINQNILSDTMNILKVFYNTVHYKNDLYLIEYIKMYIYLTPIYVVILYINDIVNNNNTEKIFFANLSNVFIECLDQ